MEYQAVDKVEVRENMGEEIEWIIFAVWGIRESNELYGAAVYFLIILYLLRLLLYCIYLLFHYLFKYLAFSFIILR